MLSSNLYSNTNQICRQKQWCQVPIAIVLTSQLTISSRITHPLSKKSSKTALHILPKQINLKEKTKSTRKLKPAQTGEQPEDTQHTHLTKRWKSVSISFIHYWIALEPMTTQSTFANRNDKREIEKRISKQQIAPWVAGKTRVHVEKFTEFIRNLKIACPWTGRYV